MKCQTTSIAKLSLLIRVVVVAAATAAAAAAAEQKICSSSLHKVKGFADNLTVISSNVKSYQVALDSLVLKAGDIYFGF